MQYEIRTGGREASLAQVLAARDARAPRRAALLGENASLAVLTVNIPGPVKLSPMTCAVFSAGISALRDALGAPPRKTLWRVTGAEAYFVSPLPPDRLKRLTSELEEEHPLGRLMDVDVFAPDGAPYSREALGLPRRRCLLCAGDAAACGRARAHPVAELVAWADECVERYERARCTTLPEQLGRLAQDALYEEVWATPKPGLVDRRNNGAHTDMDYADFLASATVLRPWFVRCAQEGVQHASPSAAFAALRPLGLEAERDMYAATNGINTHKGALFSLGLLCAAAARVAARGERLSPSAVCEEAKVMTQGLCAREYTALDARPALTRGERMFLAHGVRGVRGQAEAGFPDALHTALPCLGGAGERNEQLVTALLRLMATLQDTNVLGRGGADAAQSVCVRADACRTPEDALALDDALTREGLSPGGCADLLAVSVFFDSLKTII